MSLDSLSHLGITIQHNVSLSHYSTFQLGGPAKAVVTCCTPGQLLEICAQLRKGAQPFIVIGEGFMERGAYFQSNRKTRIYLDAIGDLIGAHGLAALLRLAGLHAWAVELPPYTDDLAVDFGDIAVLSEKLELMYGPGGGRALSVRAGRASFKALVDNFGEKLGMAVYAV